MFANSTFLSKGLKVHQVYTICIIFCIKCRASQHVQAPHDPPSPYHGYQDTSGIRVTPLDSFKEFWLKGQMVVLTPTQYLSCPHNIRTKGRRHMQGRSAEPHTVTYI